MPTNRKVRFLNDASRITIIGPLPPLRGGIAKHTLNLIENLGEDVGWHCLSPSKLYPDWLYPGKSQFDSDFDQGYSPPKTSRMPLRRIARNLIKDESKGPVVLIWWTSFLGPLMVLWKLVSKLKRRKVIIFCHNVLPHDSNILDRFVARAVFSGADASIVQSASEREALREAGFRGESFVLPHPLDKDAHGKSGKLVTENSESEIHKYLFIGLIRDYKNVPLLLTAFSNLDDPKMSLRIIGEPWSSKLDREITSMSLRDARVRYVGDYVSDTQFNEELLRADTLVLPYKHVTGSGVIASGLALGKKLVLSDIPGFTEIVGAPGQIQLFSLDDPQGLQKAMIRAKDSKFEPTFEKTSGISWGEFAKQFIGVVAKY